MTAPGGVCEFCGNVLHWTFMDGEMWTSCPVCLELELCGMEYAEAERREDGARRDEDLRLR